MEDIGWIEEKLEWIEEVECPNCHKLVTGIYQHIEDGECDGTY